MLSLSKSSTLVAVSSLVTGDVGSVQSAVTAGAEAAERVGEIITRHVIARPAEQMLSLYLK
jgi:ethanolamine utilization protein EutM